MIIKLVPACKTYLWGGDRLVQQYNKTWGQGQLAETWELSCHPDGESVISGGPYHGWTLSRYLQAYPDAAGTNCAGFDRFPVLIKFIDAAQNLSVQVHPSDDYALAHENQYGKTEMWYVLDCAENAGIYYGFNRDLTAVEFETLIRENQLLKALRFIPVTPGDSFFIEAGTIHAIGAGITIAEIQQNSNLTYRVYDYGRVGPDGKQRELHIAQALNVTNLHSTHPQQDFGGHLGCCRYFTVDHLCVMGNEIIEADGNSFRHLLILEGNGTVQGGDTALSVRKGNSIFLPAGMGRCNLSGQLTALVTSVPTPAMAKNEEET